MRNIKQLFVAGIMMPLLAPVISYAQENTQSYALEEIVVTGRKREETLEDIPVSATVFNAALIEDAGIVDLYDFFELVPGLHYDEEGDRLAALPSIRGVQSNDIASNRTKVTAFIDGIPVLGSQGSIGFNGFQQVEVYRGPQSAAFGRSTFAGAINYVTRDPGEEFAGNVGVNFSDYGTRIVNGSLDIPISETLGVIINASIEDSDSPSEYHANGNAAENLSTGANIGQSDGTEYGARSGENISAKFVFEPSDNFKASFGHTYVATEDQPEPDLFLTEAARNECFEGQGIRAAEGMTSISINGEYNCDWDNFRQNYANHDDRQWLIDNPALLASVVDTAIMNGAMAVDFNGTTLSVEEQALLVAQGYSIPNGERGTQSERNRSTLQLDYLFDSGSALQFSYMHNSETSQRASDVSVYYYDPDNVGIFDDGTINGMAPGTGVAFDNGVWSVGSGMGFPRVIGASETEIDEDYLEVRWVSPAEDRLRYVAGASYYDYNFLEERYGNDMRAGGLGAVGFGASLSGIVPEVEFLTGTTFEPDNGVIGENTTNVAAFFNIGYDITHKITASIEGRYQSDEVAATNVETGLSRDITTDSFVPRVAITYDISDQSSVYFQWSQGVNPAGINIAALDSDIINNLASGIPNALIPFNPALNVDANEDLISDGYDADLDIWFNDANGNGVFNAGEELTGETFNSGFSQEDIIAFEEEELTNIEFGFKGTLLDGRLSYAGAIYMIDWKDQLQNGTIDIGGPCANPGNAGDPTAGSCLFEGQEFFFVDSVAGSNANIGLNFGDVDIKGIELEGSYRINDNFDVRAQASYLKAEYEDFCDIALFESLNLSGNQGYLDALGLTVVRPGAGDSLQSTCYDTSGNEVAGQPSFSGSISPSYSTDINGMRFNTRLDIRHEGDQYLTSGNFQKYGATTTANLSLSLSADAWSVTLYANNLFDENAPRRVSSGGDDTDVFGLIDTVPGATSTDFLGDSFELSRDNYRFSPRIPRTIGLRASYSF